MSASIPHVNPNENLFISSAQEQKEKDAIRQRGEDQVVTHDDFLQLLVTQLTNQDPMQPMQDTDMMAQFAQMQQLDNQTAMTEAMVDMRNEYAMQGASSMIGREVTATDQFGGETTGIVAATEIEDGSVLLRLDNGEWVSYSNVSNVREIEESENLREGANIVHKFISGVSVSGSLVEDVVQNVTMEDGVAYAETYGGHKIAVNDVEQIRELTLVEESDLQEALIYINQYVQTYNEDGSVDQGGLIESVFRRDNIYWGQTFDGQEIYIKDIEQAEYLTAEQMQDLEEAKEYVGKFIKANDTKMWGIVEGLRMIDGNFYLTTARSETIDLKEVTQFREPFPSDLEDFGNADDLTELQRLNLENLAEDWIGRPFSGYTPDDEPIEGVVRSVYFRNGLILYSLGDGKEAVSPASSIPI